MHGSLVMSQGLNKTVLLIIGMRGNGCRECISTALEEVAGVTDVDVNLYRARAVILHEQWRCAADLARVVEKAGYRTGFRDARGNGRDACGEGLKSN